jgi:hypothetical protein
LTQPTYEELLAPCRNPSATLVIVGYGDGSLVEAVAADSRLRKKDIFALVLPGETLPPGQLPPANIAVIKSWEDLQGWFYQYFGTHQDIVRLGGADFIDTHPIAPEAEVFRSANRTRFNAVLADRPWALGNDINDTFMGLYHAGINAATLLPSPSLGDVAGIFGDRPAISIGAGPSVKDHLEELRALQDKAILVACDAIYGPLLEAGITAHFVTPLERLRQQSDLLKGAASTRTIFAGIPACHPDLVRLFENRTIYVHAMDRLYDWLAPKEELRCLTGSSTGVLSVLVAASLTRGKVYLVGHDLAKGPNGTTHFEGAEFAREAQEKESKNSGGFGANGYEQRFVPGNDGNLVESIMWWDTFRMEISTQAKLIPGRIINVNAHTRRYALIENTGAEALPDPSTLPDLPEIRVEQTHTDRLGDWRDRARLLPDDCRAFQRAMADFRSDCAKCLALDPNEWNLDTLLGRMNLEAGITPGNAAAFGYFLRSAITNEQMYMAHRARSFQSKEQSVYHTIRSMDALADALIKAVETVKPCLQEIADGAANAPASTAQN